MTIKVYIILFILIGIIGLLIMINGLNIITTEN